MGKQKIKNKRKARNSWIVRNQGSICVYIIVICFYIGVFYLLLPKKSVDENIKPIGSYIVPQRALALSETTLPDNLPLRLFDVLLTVESNIINKSSDLVARTEFTSFGTEPTLVKLDYRIEDSSHKTVFTESVEAIVETEKIITKTFPNLNIGNGKYSLILTTTYGKNVVDEFRHEFEVKIPSYTTIITLLSFLLTIIICYFVLQHISKNKKEFMRL